MILNLIFLSLSLWWSRLLLLFFVFASGIIARSLDPVAFLKGHALSLSLSLSLSISLFYSVCRWRHADESNFHAGRDEPGPVVQP